MHQSLHTSKINVISIHIVIFNKDNLGKWLISIWLKYVLGNTVSDLFYISNHPWIWNDAYELDLTFVGSRANAHYFPSHWNVMTCNTTLRCYILWVGIYRPPTILSPMMLVSAFSYILWPTIYTINYVSYKRFLHMAKHVFSIYENCAQIYNFFGYRLIQFETKNNRIL